MEVNHKYVIERMPTCIHVEFDLPHWVLSSAVLNGGLVRAKHIVNLNVEENFVGRKGPFEPPDVTLCDYCQRMGWEGVAVGMMTAASMDSFRKVRRVVQGVEVAALVTAGVSNARCAGDPAEWREMGEAATERGTINIIVLTNARLTHAAMVEAVMTATEAKSAALQELAVRSATTGLPATGTGTDSIAIASGFGPTEIRYCGKHVIFGEVLASTVMQAVTTSLKGRLNQ
ncbi:adenosylcobinamide amidohydrolase [Candidatus Poribacteria bacterium]|nr:adenosylcobinamide amidohydrolase [Candidatus Poribacteria bacterium]